MTIKSKRSLSEFEQQYPEYTWEDLSPYIISPGLIDLNVSFNNELLATNEENEEVESECSTSLISLCDQNVGYEQGTRAAISGGVTTVIETPSIHHKSYEIQDYITSIEKIRETELYCDIGLLAHIHNNNLDELQNLIKIGIMGFKIYTIPPAFEFPFLTFEKLEEAMALFEKTQKPVFFHPEKTSERFVYIRSPYISQDISNRINNKINNLLDVCPAAFPESMEMSGCEISPLSGCASTQAMTPLSSKRLLYDEELEKYLRLQSSSIEPLAINEFKSYEEAGITKFDKDSQKKINECTKNITITINSVPANEVESQPKSMKQGRRQRPPSISCSKFISNKERNDYNAYLGNYSYHWEIEGVKAIISGLKKYPKCKVHISNLSIADSLHKIKEAKKEIPDLQLTSETAGFYLYFSSDQIKPGDTRFKASPPIREERNRRLLINALLIDEIDTISSFHRPIKPHLKFLNSGDFKRAVSGVSSIGTTLQLINTLYEGNPEYKGKPEYIACKLAKLLSETPANTLGLDNKGTISQGKMADLVVWDPRSWSETNSLHMKQISPFSGEKLLGKVFQTYLHGKLAYNQGIFIPNGRLL